MGTNLPWKYMVWLSKTQWHSHTMDERKERKFNSRKGMTWKVRVYICKKTMEMVT
jgi:hypothetical protein